MASVKKRTWTTSKGEARSAWRVDWTDQNGKRQRTQRDTKREADDFRVTIEGQLKDGTFRADARTVTVSEAAETYIEMMKGRHLRGEQVTRTYLDLLKGVVANYIDPTDASNTDFRDGVGKLKLAKLTASAVTSFRDRMRDAGTSPYHTRRVLSVLSRVLDHAIERDLIAVNAARKIKVIGRRDETNQKVTPPPKASLAAMIKRASEDTSLRIKFAASTGLRASEQWALRWHHLNLDAGTVTVETRVDRYGDEDTTKTKAGLREVPIGASLITELKAWKLKSKYSTPDNLVFPNTIGGHTAHINFLHRKFEPLFKEDIAPFTWHGLRHFAVSTWIEYGLAPKTVQTFAGHSSLQVTMDRYGHMFPSDDHRKAMDAIGKDLFGP